MEIFARILAAVTRKFHPRGTQRILRILFNPEKFRFKGTISYGDGLLVNIDTSSYVEWDIFFRGQYEKKVVDIFKKFIKEGSVAVDAGAYIGTHTLPMAKLAGEKGKILAFEPHPDIRGKLADNIGLNGFNNIKIFGSALSDKEGKTNLFSYSDRMLDKGTSSLYELNNLEKSFEVRVSTLDKLAAEEKLSRLDLIKIDTRGSDFPIIRGAAESIKKFKPAVIFEYNRDNWNEAGFNWGNAKSFFDGIGYVLHLISDNNLTPIMEEPTIRTSHNILAVPNGQKRP